MSSGAPQHTTTKAIVLRRTDYGEADRIISLLTADLGKVSAAAKGVRKMRSKLAGGIELLAVNEVTLIKGKGDLYTLRSARMQKSLVTILESYEANQRAFAALKQISRLVEEGEGAEFYVLLEAYLSALNDGLDLEIAELWWNLRLLAQLGHAPNLIIDSSGNKLEADKTYLFSADAGVFSESTSTNSVGADTIKLWRLALQLEPMSLGSIKQCKQLATQHLDQLRLFAANHIQ